MLVPGVSAAEAASAGATAGLVDCWEGWDRYVRLACELRSGGPDWIEGCPDVGYDPALIYTICRAFPEDMAKAVRVAQCESHWQMGPDAWGLHGGPFQLARYWEYDAAGNGVWGWGPYMKQAHGWEWSSVTDDVATAIAATREVYDRNGGSFEGGNQWPYCGYS